MTRLGWKREEKHPRGKIRDPAGQGTSLELQGCAWEAALGGVIREWGSNQMFSERSRCYQINPDVLRAGGRDLGKFSLNSQPDLR